MSSKIQAGRLAMRHEGDYWVAYFTNNDSMDGAIKLGSIHLGLVEEHKSLRECFFELMKASTAKIVEDTLGVSPTWGEPESGHS